MIRSQLMPREGAGQLPASRQERLAQEAAGEEVWGMHTKQPTTKPSTKPTTTAAPVLRRIGLAYEWFLELPVALVLLVMWMAGTALLGACALLMYAGISAVVGMVAGTF